MNLKWFHKCIGFCFLQRYKYKRWSTVNSESRNEQMHGRMYNWSLWRANQLRFRRQFRTVSEQKFSESNCRIYVKISEFYDRWNNHQKFHFYWHLLFKIRVKKESFEHFLWNNPKNNPKVWKNASSTIIFTSKIAFRTSLD